MSEGASALAYGAPWYGSGGKVAEMLDPWWGSCVGQRNTLAFPSARYSAPEPNVSLSKDKLAPLQRGFPFQSLRVVCAPRGAGPGTGRPTGPGS
jgi:hypothetical protein